MPLDPMDRDAPMLELQRVDKDAKAAGELECKAIDHCDVGPVPDVVGTDPSRDGPDPVDVPMLMGPVDVDAEVGFEDIL